MKTLYSKSIMTSYATFKELYKSNKYNSPYQILSEFIRYIIASKSLYSFTSTDIQQNLKSEFGFNPPLAVIRTALKKTQGVTRGYQTYNVSGVQGDKNFLKYRNDAEERSLILTDALLKYAEQNKIVNFNKNKLSQEFISFVLDEHGDSQYQQLIGSFVLANENNKEITSAISAIREGSILYSGLAFNISETGSINQQLTLFLDTEILFDIAGLNGVLYKTLAEDFIKLVSVANKRKKVITLKYFSKVKDDIDQFYDRAEKIVEGQGEINFTEAMKEIAEGCHDVSDVSDKKVDLYRKLRTEFGISIDEKKNYYTEEDNKYNLEGMELSDFPITDTLNNEGFMFCSHINKLRKGYQAEDYLSSKYLCVSDTRRVLEISNAIAENQRNPISGEKYCDYVVSLSYITNLLWYKLNRGFGSTEFPKNLDVIIKARTILSGYITQGISSTYRDIRAKVISGDLTQEQAAARIVALKEKSTLPEKLNKENIDESLDFSDEHFAQFEETLAQERRLLYERDKTIGQLKRNLQELQDQLSQATEENKTKQNQILNLTDRVNAIEEQERLKTQKIQDIKALFHFVWTCVWRILVAVVIVVVIWKICVVLKVDFPTWLGIIIGMISILIAEIPGINKRWSIYKQSTRHSKDSTIND